jgi:hypothetical protein
MVCGALIVDATCLEENIADVTGLNFEENIADVTILNPKRRRRLSYRSDRNSMVRITPAAPRDGHGLIPTTNGEDVQNLHDVLDFVCEECGAEIADTFDAPQATGRLCTLCMMTCSALVVAVIVNFANTMLMKYMRGITPIVGPGSLVAHYRGR